MPSPSATTTSNAAIDAIINQDYPNHEGVSLGIYRNGLLVYGKAYGFRDRGLPESFYGRNTWQIPQPDQVLGLPRGQFAPDLGTTFDIASITKSFTAGAILLLQQDGSLSVSDPLSKYFPGFPNGDSISILYLLQHRSGLVDYHSFSGAVNFTTAYSAFLAGGQTNYQPIVDKLATFPLLFPPGTKYNYSNTDYLLLSLIVARVSGETFPDFLQRRIFEPLSMTHTQLGYPSASLDLALGYEDVNAVMYRAWQADLPWWEGAAGLTSTVGDLEQWDAALRQPGLFSLSSLNQMFTPGPIPNYYGGYAEGWYVASLRGHLYIWHNGILPGFKAMNATFPNDALDIIILTNAGTGTDPIIVTRQVFPIALGLQAR